MLRGADDYSPNDDSYKECTVCNNEYGGTCPVNSSDCPFLHEQEKDDEDDLEFDEVEHIDTPEEVAESQPDLELFEGEFDA